MRYYNFFEKKISASESKFPWLVYEINNTIVGYTCSSPWKPRPVYKYTAEIPIHLRHDIVVKEIGTILYQELITQLRLLNFNVLIEGITLPPCAILHEKIGF